MEQYATTKHPKNEHKLHLNNKKSKYFVLKCALFLLQIFTPLP